MNCINLTALTLDTNNKWNLCCQCILTAHHIVVEGNHFSQKRKDIFGRRDVVESFRLFSF